MRGNYVLSRLCLPCEAGECYGCYGGSCRCWCEGNATGHADAIKALHAAVETGRPKRTVTKGYDRLAKERDGIETELLDALAAVDRLRGERLRVHNLIGQLIGAPETMEAC